ncbi:CHAP domain-containing protein, partial [Allokutzneria albata]|uniref:CHAP domain-containing protein n=1 Tax=Allokutzneria albata TaxID=211114 RepID=A0A1G9Z2V8_ALLAB
MKPTRNLALAALLAMTALGSAVAIAPPAIAAEYEVRAGDDYPYKGQSGTDKWGFYKRQCTSFVAHRLDQHGVRFKNAKYKGVFFGNADTWNNAAKSAGVKVNKTPKVGAVAVWERNSGHVAWVSKVSGGKITVEEYNWNNPKAYGKRTISKNEPDSYVHF